MEMQLQGRSAKGGSKLNDIWASVTTLFYQLDIQ